MSLQRICSKMGLATKKENFQIEEEKKSGTFQNGKKIYLNVLLEYKSSKRSLFQKFNHVLSCYSVGCEIDNLQLNKTHFNHVNARDSNSCHMGNLNNVL